MSPHNAPGSAKGNRQRVLMAVLEAREPVTVRDVADAVGFSYRFVRAKLSELWVAGTVRRSSVTTGRRGPTYVYSPGYVAVEDTIPVATPRPHRERVLAAVMEASEPVTSRHIADELGIHYDSARRCLVDLCASGTLYRERRPGIGGGHWRWFYSSGQITDQDPEPYPVPARKAPLARAELGEGERLMRLVGSTKTMGHRGLVCAILIVAIRDWRCPDPALQRFVDRCRDAMDDCDWQSPRDEVMDFWESPDGQLYREALGCGMLDLRDIAADPSVQGRPERWS